MNFKIKNLSVYIILLGVSFIIFGILFQNKAVLGHDSFFHISNIYALKESILSGNWFFPKIYPIIANDFGYGTGLFYGPLFHYLSALLSVVDIFHQLSIITIMKIINFLAFFLSGIFMFHFAEKIFKNKWLSLLVSIIYMTFPYRISDIYVRDAFLESISFTFIPLIFNGLYELLYNNNSKKFYLLFILGTSCLILTHTITTFYTFIFCILFLLLNFQKVFNLNIIKKFSISAIFILCLTSFYTIPLIEQKIFTSNNIFQATSTTNPFAVSSSALEISNFFPIKGNQSYNGVQFFILIPTIFMFLFTIIEYRKIKLKNKQIIFDFTILGVLALFMTTKLFPWQYMPACLLYIQFPWRLLLLASFFISIASVAFLVEMKKELHKVIFIFISILLVSMSISYININRIVDYAVNDIDINTNGIGAINDYFPSKTLENFDYYNNRNKELAIISGKGKLQNIQIKPNYISFEAIIKQEPLVVELPLLYYYGYKANCEYTHDNLFKEKPKLYENEKGFVEVSIKKSCRISISFIGSPFMKASYYVTIITAIGFTIFIRKLDQKNKQEKIRKKNNK